jgi:hypothetical protein
LKVDDRVDASSFALDITPARTLATDYSPTSVGKGKRDTRSSTEDELQTLDRTNW